jgi:hypothetical protein
MQKDGKREQPVAMQWETTWDSVVAQLCQPSMEAMSECEAAEKLELSLSHLMGQQKQPGARMRSVLEQ